MRAGEKDALRDVTGKTESATSKRCRTFRIVETTCVTGTDGNTGCWTSDVEYVTICSEEGGGGGGGGAGSPYPGGGGGGGGTGTGGDGEDELCSSPNPPPGSDCIPTNPCERADPPDYCTIDDLVNETKVCPDDPLKDMDIRPTCAGIEGGRFGGRGGDHEGLDLLADVGTEVTARGDGAVWSKNQNDTFGRYIIVRSDGGDTFTMYAHLSSRSVEGGDPVVAGETKIGETGTSGNACDNSCSCGPAHLHLEMRQGGDGWGDSNPVDPENHLGTGFDDSTGQPTSDSC